MNMPFRTQKPIIAMVHLQYGGSLQQLIDEALTDAERLERGGIDGLLFENWGGDYTDRFVTQETREYITAVINEARKMTKLPYGLNLLPLDYKADFDIARQTDAGFVQIDTFVDKVRTDYKNRFILDIDPQKVIGYRNRLNLENVALLTNIQTKHYTTVPHNKKLWTSAIQAVQEGADALVVTGEKTGMEIPVGKIIGVKKVAGDIPVGSGSGVNADNVGKILQHSDFAIVGTSLKYDGVTENPVDEDRVKWLMEIVYGVRG